MKRTTLAMLGFGGPWLLCALACSEPDLELGSSNDAGTGGDGGGNGSGGAGTGGGSGATSQEPLSVAVGGDHVCALRDGTVWCWGGSSLGQTGRAPSASALDLELDAVSGLDDVVEIAASVGHTCARGSDGRVACWGANGAGQVGPESAPALTCYTVVLDKGPQDLPCQPVPTTVPGVEDAVELALGPESSCARLASGEITCWGDLSDGPEWLMQQTGADQIAVGNGAACAVRDGQLSCSDGAAPQLGSVERVVMSAGSRLVCARHDGGRVTCWGPNANGERGIGSDTSTDLPPAPAIDAGAGGLALGEAHGCALGAGGTVWCWGRNYAGAVGVAPQATPECVPGIHCVNRPRAVPGVPPAVSVAALGEASCAVTEANTIWCWGTHGGGLDVSGVPQYLAGPWEDGPVECASIKQTIGASLFSLSNPEPRPCLTVHDCTQVVLDLPCHHGCATGPVTRAQAAEIQSGLSALADQVCGAGCPAPDSSCAPPAAELACDQGSCIFFDPVARGCSDPCDCRVQAATWSDTLGCSGTDLYVWGDVPCVGCGSSKTTLLIANRGQTRFEGSVAIQVGPTDSAGFESPAELPQSLQVELAIEPGTLSKTVVLDVPAGPGAVHLDLVAADDCDSSNDRYLLSLPEVASCQ